MDIINEFIDCITKLTFHIFDQLSEGSQKVQIKKLNYFVIIYTLGSNEITVQIYK